VKIADGAACGQVKGGVCNIGAYCFFGGANVRLGLYRDSVLRIAAFLTALLLAGCGASNPQTIELTSATDDAGVLLLYAMPANVDYHIRVVGYDPVTQQAQDALLNGWGEAMRVDADKTATTPKFIVRRVTPGTYVYQSLSQQLTWAVCFHENTLSFTVKPGQVLFLGTFNAAPHLADLNKNVLVHKDFTSRDREPHHYFDGITPPQIILPGSKPEILAKAKAFVLESMPNVRADVVPASYSKVKFGTGQTLYGKRICGGYSKEDVKPRAAGQ
jgi:hypothetical protein